jgi:hypothetical protein
MVYQKNYAYFVIGLRLDIQRWIFKIRLKEIK